jgi:hypothetical protein
LQAATHIAPGGEIWSPVLKSGGQFSVRTPQRCAIGLLGIAKLEIQTLSSPSTAAAVFAVVAEIMCLNGPIDVNAGSRILVPSLVAIDVFDVLDAALI